MSQVTNSKNKKQTILDDILYDFSGESPEITLNESTVNLPNNTNTNLMIDQHFPTSTPMMPSKYR